LTFPVVTIFANRFAQQKLRQALRVGNASQLNVRRTLRAEEKEKQILEMTRKIDIFFSKIIKK